jgi:hypothetical protein
LASKEFASLDLRRRTHAQVRILRYKKLASKHGPRWPLINSPQVVAAATKESKMVKRVLLALTFVAALGAAGFGLSGAAQAGHGCGYGGGYGYGGYGYGGGYGHSSYYPSYHSHYGGYGYGPRVSYYGGHGHHGYHGHHGHHGHHDHGGVHFSFGF